MRMLIFNRPLFSTGSKVFANFYLLLFWPECPPSSHSTFFAFFCKRSLADNQFLVRRGCLLRGHLLKRLWKPLFKVLIPFKKLSRNVNSHFVKAGLYLTLPMEACICDECVLNIVLHFIHFHSIHCRDSKWRTMPEAAIVSNSSLNDPCSNSWGTKQPGGILCNETFWTKC